MGHYTGFRRSRRLASCHPRSGVALVHAFAALLACGGERMVVGEEVPLQGEDDTGTDDASARGISVVADCPSSPEERKVRLGCWPSPHVGRWRGFLLGNPMYETARGGRIEFPLTDIVLSVDPFGSARLSFGDPVYFQPPAGSGDAYLCAGRSPSVGCTAAEGIIEGYAYPLEDLALFDATVATTPLAADEFALRIGAGLTFDVPLDEPWRVWCALQEPERGSCAAERYGAAALGCYRLGVAPDSVDNDACLVIEGEVTRSVDCGWLAARENAPCRCTDDGCSTVRAALSMSLRLSNDGQALRGRVLAPQGRELGHLEFLREPP